MKTKFMMLLAAMLLSASAFAQSENNEPLKGDVNGDGKVDVADINEIIKIMKEAGGTAETPTYYWYLGYDQDLYDNTESSKEKMLTLTTNAAPTNYTRASGNKFYMNGPTPNYIIMVIPTTWPVPVIGNPAGGELNLGKEKSNVKINGIPGVTFDVYSTTSDKAIIREVYIN